jgi:sigma-E factor negative regulatory protein RseA
MTQQQEKLSAFIDGETGVSNQELITDIENDSEMRAKWQSYHIIRDGLRGELGQSKSFDISSAITQAIADEPVILAPKRRLLDVPVIGSVIPLVKQSGQYLVAASVAAVVILGVQNYNREDVSEPFSTAPPITGPQGGLTPVSLEQTRSVQRNDMASLLEQRRLINALIADHQSQLRMQQPLNTEPNMDDMDDNASEPEVDSNQSPQP